jgi:hypothetical protein
VKQITGDFIKSNTISVEKYISEKHLEFYFQTKTRYVVSTCIDYLNGLMLLPYRKNMRKMAIYCCRCSNNQPLSHFISSSPWRSADLLKSVRTKAIQTIGKNGVLILDESGIKNLEIVLLEFLISIAATLEKKIIVRLVSSLLILRKRGEC